MASSAMTSINPKADETLRMFPNLYNIGFRNESCQVASFFATISTGLAAHGMAI